VGGAEGFAGREYQDMRLSLSSTPALTPGGLVWKMSEVLSVLAIRIEEDDGKFECWDHLLSSAMTDAVELERAQQAAECAPGGAS
jgi:hypothetical protein